MLLAGSLAPEHEDVASVSAREGTRATDGPTAVSRIAEWPMVQIYNSTEIRLLDPDASSPSGPGR